jgi:hypothetical protein
MQTATTHHEEADMPRKDIHSDVEGHGFRGPRAQDAEPESTDTQQSPTDEPEVEGQLVRGKGAPAAEVEGHAYGRIE